MGAFTFRVDGNFVDVRRYMKGIEAGLRKDAVVPAVNKTAARVKTAVVRQISKEAGSKQKPLRKKIVVIKARKGSSARARNFATVDASEAKSINLIEYVRPSQRKTNFFNKSSRTKRGEKKYKAKGVIATVGKKRKTYGGAFIGTAKGGDLKVFRRIGRRRDKITQVPGPSPGAYFKRPATHAFMRKVAETHFPVELNRAVKMVIAREARKNR